MFRVAGGYAVVGWVIAQIAMALETTLGLPDWFDRFVVVLLLLGFPVALLLAWAFELTPEGVRRTTAAAADHPARPFALADVAIVAALLAVVGIALVRPVLFTSQAEPDAVAPTAAGAVAESAGGAPAIAVLPFVNMSSDAEQEYFSDGLSEELLNQLAQIEELQVIGRTSSFAFKGQNTDLRSIGEQLNASHLLEGSVRKSADRLRITAQLIEASSGVHLWSQTYDRRLDDVFAIQDEIARAVADALSVTLGVRAASANSGLTDDVETYDLYLRARAQMGRFAPEDFTRAVDLFRAALTRDPGFSRARAGLVHASYYAIIYVPERRTEADRAIAEAIAEGNAHAPDDWATHLAVAVRHMNSYEGAPAEDAFARAVARAPASALELDELRSQLLLNLGRAEDALEVFLNSITTDPLAATRSWTVQFALGMLGRTGEVEAEYQRSRDLPGADAREDIAHWALMMVWNSGDTARIESRFDAFLARQTVPTPWLAQVRAVYDAPDAALTVIRAAYDDPANQDPTRLQFVASYAAHFGDADLALAAMRRGLVGMTGANVTVLWWPEMAGVRRLPGFKEIAREIGFADYWRRTGNWGDFCRPLGADDFECR